MSAPIWMASPPEVHSTLLSSGPGPASLFAAAAAWSSMEAEYASAAEELATAVVSTQAEWWQGPSAASYVSAHAPYLAWLTQAGEHSAAAAAGHEAAATAYTAALTTMPTLPELAANHVAHVALVATNFFGINTIPLAVNEADYARMWVQAAATMTTYQAVSDAAVAAVPHDEPAPPIVKGAVQPDEHDEEDGDHHDHEHGFDSPLNQLVSQILQLAGIDWDPVEGMLNGLALEDYANPGDPLWWVARSLELFSDFQQFGALLQENPAAAIQFVADLVLLDYPTHLAQLTSWLPIQSQLFVVPLLVAVAPLGALGGFAGLAGLAPPPAPAPTTAPTATAPSRPAALATNPSAALGTAPSSAPAPAHTAGTVAGPSLPGPLAANAAPFVPPFAVAPPSIGFDSGMNAGAAAAAKRDVPKTNSTSQVPSAVARSRRLRRPRLRGSGDEFVQMTAGVDPDRGEPATMASEHGAGNVGFTGTANKGALAAAGLTTLAADEFGGGPSVPMIPGGWDRDTGA